MEITEEFLTKITARIIAKHFPGLKSRGVRIDNTIQEFARADEPNMIFNARLHKSIKEVEATITHELIHYELGDSGKYSGHGRDFKKRARRLGILGSIELSQCFSLEEETSKPHHTEVVKIPLKEVGDGIIIAVKNLKKLASRVPMKLREKIYREAQSIEASWHCYQQAVERGEDFIFEERIRLRRGPKGKSLDLLLREQKELQSRVRELFEKLKNSEEQPSALAALKKANRQLSRIDEILDRDYL